MAVVEQVAAVLKALSQSEEGMTVMELAAAVNLPRSTMSRLLMQMRTYGLIERDLSTQRHRPGLLIGEAARRCSAGNTLIDRADRVMARFSREVGHTTGLVFLEGDHVREIRSCVGSAPLRVVLPPGEIGPVFGTGTGRSLLAWLTDAEIAARFRPSEDGLYEIPPKTLDELMARIVAIRRRGWETTIPDRGTEIGGISVAFEDPESGQRLSIYTVFSRLHVSVAQQSEVGEHLLAMCAELGRVMGPGWSAGPDGLPSPKGRATVEIQ
jgi:IclR family transcriptional regulator, KDG regulon repressor